MSCHSPLAIPILQILRNGEGSISEHELIIKLKEELSTLTGNDLSQPVTLFQTHFLVMNALYQLQREVAKDQQYLHISALKIYLQPVEQGGDKAVADSKGESLLRDYYLDSKNLEEVSEEEVERLLGSFWQRYLAEDKQLAAYEALDLQADVSWSEVQSTYRRLVRQYHPDKGGSSDRFMEIREAYEVLSQLKPV